MDINQNSSSMMNGMPPVPKQEKKVGPIVAALVIVLLLIIGAFYLFGKRLNTNPSTNTEPVVQNTQGAQSTPENSANVSSAENDAKLNADLDAQLKDVDYSF